MSNVLITGNASGTGTLTVTSPNTNTDRTLTLPDATTTFVGTDTTQTLTNKTIGSGYGGGVITLGASQNSTSGTSIDFAPATYVIPSWAKRITVMFNGVSTSGSSNPLIQLGTSAGFENTGYTGATCNVTNAAATVAAAMSTTGFNVNGASAGNVYNGSFLFHNISSNTWVTNWTLGVGGTMFFGGGSKTLSAVLTQLRITTVNGTDTFDAGSIGIMWEG